MLEEDPLYPEGYGGKHGIKERGKTSNIRDLRRAAMPRVLKLFLPGYTPHAFELQSPENAGKLYAEMAATKQV